MSIPPNFLPDFSFSLRLSASNYLTLCASLSRSLRLSCSLSLSLSPSPSWISSTSLYPSQSLPSNQCVFLFRAESLYARAHGNEFFSSSRMNSDGRVKMSLCRTCLDSHACKLHDFWSSIATHMNCQHFIGFGVHDKFHEGLFLSLGKCVLHAAEGRLVDVYIPILLTGGSFGGSHSAHRRVRKHSSRYVGIVNFAWFARKQRVSEAMALGKGNGCECNSINHIANSIDILS
mmetsp:Transcript_45597/g.66829  ORF Transcript_45597/g.66829 Transcript_45597/m.66829 type:complete len:232 (-) Transcript_45597:952-1647(-)